MKIFNKTLIFNQKLDSWIILSKTNTVLKSIEHISHQRRTRKHVLPIKQLENMVLVIAKQPTKSLLEIHIEEETLA